MKRFAVLLGAGIALALGAADLLKMVPPAQAAALVLSATPIPLSLENPAQIKLGDFMYRGGLDLRSTNKEFGGLSGLRVLADGTALAIGDTGIWASFTLVEKREQLVGVRGIGLAPILGFDGQPGSKKERDAEAIDYDAKTRRARVSFEGDHRVWLYEGIDPHAPDTFAHLPVADWRRPWMQFWPGNGGGEAHCTIAPDTTLTISEEGAGPDGPDALAPGTDAFVSGPAGDVRFGYRAPPGFKPTDCVGLDATGQRALVLQRRFSPMTGVAAAISLLDITAIKSGESLSAREIARLEPPLNVDNMEGISYIERGGRKFIYMISDDNFSGLQRTLLMKFEWLPAAAK